MRTGLPGARGKYISFQKTVELLLPYRKREGRREGRFSGRENCQAKGVFEKLEVAEGRLGLRTPPHLLVF